MAKAAYKCPRVFIACPYSKKFGFDEFKKYLESHFPGVVVYADTDLQTKGLLEILRNLIKKTDICFFDISLWNPNVSLELGLAEGMNANYYILLNSKFSSNVPSDIQGIQRIQYQNIVRGKSSLHINLKKYIYKQKIPITKTLWAKLKGHHKSEKMFDFALRLIAHMRDYEKFKTLDMRRLSAGLHLRDADRDELIETLMKMKLIRAGKAGNKGTYFLSKSIFKAVT